MTERVAEVLYSIIKEKNNSAWTDLPRQGQKKFCAMVDAFAGSVTSDPEFIVPPPTGEPPGGPPKP